MDPIAVVRTFLDRMANDDARGALDLVDEAIVYTNVGLPTLRGRRQVARVVNGLERPAFGFGVEMITVAANGRVVLTERIDELRVGKMRVQFWVCGRFEVDNGRITLWRDYFDAVNIGKGIARGVAALLFPALQAPLAPPVGVTPATVGAIPKEL